MHEPKYEVPGSKFRKPRTSDLEPSSVSPVPLFLSSSNSELRTQKFLARPASLARLSFGRLATIICLNRQNQENGA